MPLRCSVCAVGIVCLTVVAPLLRAQTSPTRLQVTSALGVKFYSQPDEKGVVEAAQKALAADPKNPDLLLKLALAQSAVWQYREAVDTCTSGLAIAPENAALYTERGHRKLALRDFAGARADLKRAATLDPKRPDAYYHLGLAHYFLGEFAQAGEAFGHAVDLATTEDSRVHFTNWAYASLPRGKPRREGEKSPAPHHARDEAGRRAHTVLFQPGSILSRQAEGSRRSAAGASRGKHGYRSRIAVRYRGLRRWQLASLQRCRRQGAGLFSAHREGPRVGNLGFH